MQDGQRAAAPVAQMLWNAVTSQHGEVVVILPQDVVEHWLPRMEVLSCQTWGDLKALPAEVYAEVLGLAGYESFEQYAKYLSVKGEAPLPNADLQAQESYAEVPDEVPGDSEPFVAYQALPSHADGDWPPSPFLLMTDELPEEFLKLFADREMTVFSGEFSTVSVEKKDAAVQWLADHGFTVRPDDRIRQLFAEGELFDEE